MMKKIVDPAYDELSQLASEQGDENLGLMSRFTWKVDPKRLTFMLARYKFVSKMLQGKNNVLVIGCGDGFASRIVKQTVEHLTAVDLEDAFISSS